MCPRKRLSFSELVQEEKKKILENPQALEKIESTIVEKIVRSQSS